MAVTRASKAKAAHALVLLIAVLFLIQAGPGFAQDATPVARREASGRPAQIRKGGCSDDQPGATVAPLTALASQTGDNVGQARLAVPAESSFSSVPIPLDRLLAADRSIAIQGASDPSAADLVCGEIGGVRDENDSLVIGLKEQNDSGFTGIAFLSPGTDDASTDISLFIAGDRPGGGSPARATPSAAGAKATPVARSLTTSVDVSLVEFEIDMEHTLPTGTVTFNITNDGTVGHSFAITGQGLNQDLGKTLLPGESSSLKISLKPGTYQIYCPVGHHRQQGMETKLTVK